MYDLPPEGKPIIAREAALVQHGAPAQQWVSAAEFKTHCLRLIDEIQQTRGEVVVTRYGKPVARLVPFSEEPVSLFGHLSGSIASYGDLVSPTGEAWDADA